MSINNEQYIAGKKTCKDWENDKLLIANNGSNESWNNLFDTYFITRLNYRYFEPISVLQQNGTYIGEGFSIMTILCSLIEFLESTRQGKLYRYGVKNDKLGNFEYNSSKQMFKAFLLNREPFKAIFNEPEAEEFYKNIRCGLLHEASTKNGWKIHAQSYGSGYIDFNNKIVYRDDFQNAIRQYIDDYKTELMTDTNLQQAFIRKYDFLCSDCI